MKSIKLKNISAAFVVLILSPALRGASEKDVVPDVVLKEEYVDIHIDKNYTASVNVKFIFTSTRGYRSTLAFPVSDWIVMENFKAVWNGTLLDHDIVRAPAGKSFSIADERYGSIYRFRIPATAADTSEHSISYSYRIPYISFAKDYEREGYYVEYILKTGSLWHGNVLKLNITVTADEPLFSGKITYLDSSFHGRCVNSSRWEFNAIDIELTKNLRLLIPRIN